MSRWGTTSSDLARVMAGDGLLVDPMYSGTMAVIVSAPTENIWPWLVQIAYQRGGLYSYDGLDRLFAVIGLQPHDSEIETMPKACKSEWHVATGEEPCL